MPATLSPLPSVDSAAPASSVPRGLLETHTYCLLSVATLAIVLLRLVVHSRHAIFSRWRRVRRAPTGQQKGLADSWCPEKEIVASSAQGAALAPGQQAQRGHQQAFRATESEGSSRGISSEANTANTAISPGLLRISSTTRGFNQKTPEALPAVSALDVRSTPFSPFSYRFRSAFHHDMSQHYQYSPNMASPSLGATENTREGVSAAAAAAAAASSSLPVEPEASRPFARHPPPPPLTPPTLAASIFTLDDCRPDYARSVPPELDGSSEIPFIHQPNPDYQAEVGKISHDDETAVPASSSSPSTSPRRRSYTKLVPVGTPIVPCPVPFADTSRAVEGASPSSFPSSSPLLPPPPPTQSEADASGVPQSPRQIGVRGEIISSLDDNGAGWKRHTRVYGGGVCLACLAAENGGGVYGEQEPVEEQQ